MGYNMKKYFLLIIIFLFNNCVQTDSNINIIEGEFYKLDNWSYVLNLPYEIDAADEFVFDEDTPYAIDIIEIYINGKKLSGTDNILAFGEQRASFSTHKVNKEKNEYFISMFWMSIESGKLFWDDGRLYFYQISKQAKELKIKYKIVLPYTNITIENFHDKNYKHKRYTNDYVLRVDLRKVWRSLKN